MFVLPTRNPPFLPGGAAALEVTVLAGVRPIPPHLQTLLLGGGAVCKRLARRAAIDVSLMVVGEIVVNEMALWPGAGCV